LGGVGGRIEGVGAGAGLEGLSDGRATNSALGARSWTLASGDCCANALKAEMSTADKRLEKILFEIRNLKFVTAGVSQT